MSWRASPDSGRRPAGTPRFRHRRLDAARRGRRGRGWRRRKGRRWLNGGSDDRPAGVARTAGEARPETRGRVTGLHRPPRPRQGGASVGLADEGTRPAPRPLHRASGSGRSAFRASIRVTMRTSPSGTSGRLAFRVGPLRACWCCISLAVSGTAAKGRFPGEKVVEGATQAVDVGPDVGAMEVQGLLGRQVIDRAERRRAIRWSGRCFRWRCSAVAVEPGQAQVENLDVRPRRVPGHEQVRRLDVAMHQAMLDEHVAAPGRPGA